jgi:hypothetical protein
MQNKSYLKMYLQPLLTYLSNTASVENTENLKQRMQQFYASNESDPESVFQEKAKNVFGCEVEAAYKMLAVKRLNVIQGRLTFFMVVTIIAIIIGLITAINISQTM